MTNHKVYATKVFEFEAAHFLPNYDGKCANLHGHSYKLEVTVSRAIQKYLLLEEEPTSFMAMDFSFLSKLVKSNIINSHDHAYLNNIYSVPTAEVMAVYIFDTLKSVIQKEGATLERVRLWETSTSYVDYSGEVSYSV